MEVVFTKAAHRKHFPPWVAHKGKTRIVGSGLGCDPRHLPHDIVTLVVERELGMRDGFFGTVFAGGTFRSMQKKRHAAGKAAIAANRRGLDVAEFVVNTACSDWMAGRPTECGAALDAALAAWLAVAPGESLTLAWLAPTRSQGGTRRRVKT